MIKKIRKSVTGRQVPAPGFGRILTRMTNSAPRRHLPTSPFRPAPTPQIKRFAVGDRVSHDEYGLGRAIAVEGELAVLVDFGSRQVRITAPFAKLFLL